MFTRVYRLEIQTGIFLTHLCPSITSSLVSSPPPHSLCEFNKYTVYTYTVCKGEGYGVIGWEGPSQINTCGRVPL